MTVKSSTSVRQPIVRDHRTPPQPTLRDHRPEAPPTVRDHRSQPDPWDTRGGDTRPDVRDHRSQPDPWDVIRGDVRDHRSRDPWDVIVRDHRHRDLGESGPGPVRMPPGRDVRDHRGVEVGPVQMPSGPIVRDHRDSDRFHIPERGCFPRPTDLSAREACAELARYPGKISGEQMTDAILKGVGDSDGHANSSELREFQSFARQHPNKLTPEAKAVLGIYERTAREATAKGSQGIPDADFSKMAAEMRSVKDASAYQALEKLDRTEGPIDPKQMTRTVLAGIGDRDGQAACKELEQFQCWAKENEARLTPGAKQVLALYEAAAQRAQEKGAKGFTRNEMQELKRAMRAVVAEQQPTI